MLACMMCCITGCAGEEKATVKEPEKTGTTEEETTSYVLFPEFDSVTIFGESVDSSIFADAEITMVNIWGTFCGPCINEMPDLEELHQDMPEGCAIVGVLSDVYGEQNLDEAIRIATDTGVTYMNIVPDEILYDFLSRNITGVPTTLYVDADGNILGGVVGARSKEDYKTILENLIAE